MNTKTLVIYTTQYRATAEIAEKICAMLRQTGLPADVMQCERRKPEMGDIGVARPPPMLLKRRIGSNKPLQFIFDIGSGLQDCNLLKRCSRLFSRNHPDPMQLGTVNA